MRKPKGLNADRLREIEVKVEEHYRNHGALTDEQMHDRIRGLIHEITDVVLATQIPEDELRAFYSAFWRAHVESSVVPGIVNAFDNPR